MQRRGYWLHSKATRIRVRMTTTVMNLFVCYVVILTACLTAAYAQSECTSSSNCPNYAVCLSGECICQYGNKTILAGNVTTCRECNLSSHCPKYALCNKYYICQCRFGGAGYDSTGKLISCYECSRDDDCPAHAMCSSHKCQCKYGGATYSNLGRLIYCLNECNVNDDCPPFASCNSRNKCECDYGMSYNSDGTLATCASSLATVVSIIVGIAFFLTVIIVVICVRRRSIVRAAQAAKWANFPAASQEEAMSTKAKKLVHQVHESEAEESTSSDEDVYPMGGYTRL